MTSFVEICNFSYTYPGESTSVLKDINFSLNQGDFVVITGKSGCGKSTLGKALAGFLFQNQASQHTGKIVVNGFDMTQVPLYAASERVAYVQQNPEDQFCTLTVLDEIAFGLENQQFDPSEIQKRVDKSLTAVDGNEFKYRQLSTLSGGEKQKIAIASLLALSPDVLILDEPTSNLDPDATHLILNTLYRLRQDQQLTVIIFEHKLSQLKPFTPLIYKLDAGKLNPIEEGIYAPSLIERVNSPKQNTDFEVTTKNKPILTLNNANVSIEGTAILQDISLDLYQGEFIALMGPNGSGKSTLLETMMGLRGIQSGFRKIFGFQDQEVKISKLVKDIGFIFQNPDHQLFTHSVWDEATFTSRNLNLLTDSVNHEAKTWLNSFGLENRLNDHPQRLSYGEKRRLNLLAVILHHPSLLLIDELLIGQDRNNAIKWMDILQNYTNIGNTVVLINHHAELTAAFCDRIIFLDHGELIVDAPTHQAFRQLLNMGFANFVPDNLQEAIIA